MTGELALPARRLAEMITPSAATREARLERLRAARGAGPGTTPGVPPAEEGLTARHGAQRSAEERVTALAGQLGGMVHRGSAGPVVLVEERTPLEASLDGLRHLPEPLDPARPLVCLDTETTGLGTAAGTLPFLIGMGTWQTGWFVVRQLVLADHPDEGALLAVLSDLIPSDAQLVTYNGRSFDWPLLATRYRLHRQVPPRVTAHLDLLPLARRVWRHRLPDARLASVEAGVCGVRRSQDLPAADIPSRYLAYLRTGNGSRLSDVLRHNRQDVLSLALLLRTLSEDLVPIGPSWSPGASRAHPGPEVHAVHPGDLGGLGTAFSRRGQHARALACFEAALERMSLPWQAPTYERIASHRARTLTRLGMRADAESAWHAIALEGGRGAALAWLQVAKHREHDRRHVRSAITAAERARALAERSRLFGWPDRLVERDLARRMPRLRRKLASGPGSAPNGLRPEPPA